MGILRDLWMANQAKKATDLLLGQEQPLLGPGPAETGRFGGLLGDNPTPEQYMTAGASLMGIPGFRDVGQRMMDRSFSNQNISAADQAMMDQRAQQFDRSMTEVSAFDQLRLQQQRMRDAMDAKRQQLNSALGIGKDFGVIARKENQPYRETVSNVKVLNQTLPKVGNTDFFDWPSIAKNGAQAHDVIMSYAKTVLPGEAVMSDDRGNITIASRANVPPMFRALVDKYNGGQLDGQELASLHAQTNKRAAAMYNQMEETRQWAGQYGGEQWMAPNLNFQPGQFGNVPAAAQQRVNVPSTVQWSGPPSRPYAGRGGRGR